MTVPQAPTDRHIHSHFGPRQVTDLLQVIAGAELIAPSRCLWIVSPWISDIPILENRSNAFTSFAGDWARSNVTLSALLLFLLRQGSTVRIAARPAEHNRNFFNRMREGAGSAAARLSIVATETLHEKGILGDDYYLSGSMNVTMNGITFNDEALHFFTDPAVVALHRHLFAKWWGGVLEV